MKYLFVCAHPDDLEYGCANLIHYLVQKNRIVEILCLTKGEFGIFDDNWIGPRLGKLRARELYRATEILGVSRDHVHFGDMVDGFVKFTRNNVKYLQNWLIRLKPDVVFAPEAYYSYYWQRDHINSGRLAYYAITKTDQSPNHPYRALYFYNTVFPNFFWPFNDLSMGKAAFQSHRSQWWFIRWIMMFYRLDKINSHRTRTGKWKFAEKYRRIPLYKNHPPGSWIVKAMMHFIANLKPFTPSPRRYRVPNSDSPFGKKVAALIEKHYNIK